MTDSKQRMNRFRSKIKAYYQSPHSMFASSKKVNSILTCTYSITALPSKGPDCRLVSSKKLLPFRHAIQPYLDEVPIKIGI